jgi:hypothetical protein
MDITIQYLVKSSVKEKIKKEPKKINKEFYKERIIDLTNHLLNNYDINDNMMENEFHNYLNACVNYFYRMDLKDKYQKEHKEDKLETILEEPEEKEINIFTKMMPRKKINIPFPIQKIFNEEDEELKHKRLNSN